MMRPSTVQDQIGQMVLKHFACCSFRVFSPQGVVGEKKKGGKCRWSEASGIANYADHTRACC